MRIPMLLIAFALSRICCAQLVNEAQTEMYPLQIGWDKTTVLVFPFEVVSADFGSPAVLSEKDKAAPNVLKLKAAQRYFSPTSMYVITAEGKLYPFTVGFTEYPDARPIDIGKQQEVEYAKALLDGSVMNAADISAVIEEMSQRIPHRFSWGKKSGMIRLSLGEIVEKDGLLFFQLAVENESWVDYLPQKWLFTIQDKRESKRTAIRQLTLEPISFSPFPGVEGKSAGLAVFAFPRFTIADAKELSIQIFESNGDRNPVVTLSGKKLLQVKPILISNQK
ncbi:conjugative transposon TraN protein [Algoriphagus ratkowskyi]|nr:conjugative transposon TraN protein [Algoriphagus ratkowskyi]